ncbi:MAG: hypothetical protein LDL41_25330 [Coleofasciculus sp. S288]|nr:hypothetical protein [Coleofasciculus sp. S288]
MTAPFKSPLADYLKLVIPYASADIISPETWLHISTLARVLPSAITSFFGFECRLGIEEAHADFLICADALDAGRKILAGDNYPIKLPSFLMENPIWINLCNFSNSWATPTSPLYENVRNVWLEFDIDGPPTAIPIPSCFFGPEPIYSATSTSNRSSYEWVTQTALKLLLNKDLPSQLEQNLFNCFDRLPNEAYVFQIGVMLARSSDLVRICIRDISPDQLLEYLTQINWMGSTSELKVYLTQLSRLTDRIDLDIDVGEVIRPKIGLECYFNKQPKFEPRWQSFLDYLVAMDLCLPKKREALLAYPGYTRERSKKEADLWPDHLLKLSRFLGSKYERIFFRRVHHVKVVYQFDKLLEAKAYLSGSHALIHPELLSQLKDFNENQLKEFSQKVQDANV